MSQSSLKNIEQGVECIKEYVLHLPLTPGVYRMLDENSEVLYVGKAKSLKKRVSSYTQFHKQSIRIQRMIAQTRKMEFVHTHTEAEALLLESNLIKKLKPRYNILLRDDKSFPYILMSSDHDYPQVLKHRGAKNKEGKYYGPFAGVGYVNRTIATLQRAFLLRNCTDNYFASRKRPCLQFHIKRCTAPCVGEVSKTDYAKQVKQAQNFLDGKSQEVQSFFVQEMQNASEKENYEKAAEYRDRIKALSAIHTHQDINTNQANLKDADIISLYRLEGKACIQVFFFRGGCNYGNRAYFPRHDKEEASELILSAFIAQFYQNKPIPEEIILSEKITEKKLLETALSSKGDIKVKISLPEKGTRKKLVDFALKNAKEALKAHIAQNTAQAKLLIGLSQLLELEDVPQRIEVYDNSHISGTDMIGAMIVSTPEGFQKNGYRKYNIKQAIAGDDYGMMKEVMLRRFGAKTLSKSTDIPSVSEDSPKAIKSTTQPAKADTMPDVIIIDGGRGQFNIVRDALLECGVLEYTNLISIAKGQDRHAGEETIYRLDQKPITLSNKDPISQFLQRLRDEAHRFAIGSHRQKRAKHITSSAVDDIPGIGAKRKKALLHYFGSGKAVSQAAIEDLLKVEGISKSMAQKIYDYFH